MRPPPNGRWAPYIPNIMPPNAIRPSHHDSARAWTAAAMDCDGGAGEAGVGSAGSVNGAPVPLAGRDGALRHPPSIAADRAQLGHNLARSAEPWHQLRYRLHRSRPCGGRGRPGVAALARATKMPSL